MFDHLAEITIKLEGHEYHLEKFAEQGNSGSPVYVVKSGDHKGSFAKTGYSNNEFIATNAVSIGVCFAYRII